MFVMISANLEGAHESGLGELNMHFRVHGRFGEASGTLMRAGKGDESAQLRLDVRTECFPQLEAFDERHCKPRSEWL